LFEKEGPLTALEHQPDILGQEDVSVGVAIRRRREKAPRWKLGLQELVKVLTLNHGKGLEGQKEGRVRGGKRGCKKKKHGKGARIQRRPNLKSVSTRK